MITETSTILVCAGRRIDPPGASPPRFPLQEVDRVSRQVEALFQSQSVHWVVCSAACGADLVVLQIAQRLGIRFRILLPNSPEEFRRTSVADRPFSADWPWETLYDRLIRQAQSAGDLKVLEGTATGTAGYQAVNEALVKEGRDLAGHVSEWDSGKKPVLVQALVIWDGQSRGSTDLTRHFAEEARAQGLPVLEVLTSS